MSKEAEALDAAISDALSELESSSAIEAHERPAFLNELWFALKVRGYAVVFVPEQAEKAE